jgi:2',3'-cyclic-nucleotide 2'-phosphodiesterase/3'-nucleotidase
MDQRFFARSAVLLLLMTVVVAAPAATSDTARLTVLHTSDLHGQVLPFDDARDTTHPGSLARVSALVGRIRDEVSHPVLVLDSGDTIQGTPFEQFTHVRWSRPSPTIDAMNRIGYAAMAIGNHEFNFGLGVLRRAERQAAFPLLSANTVSDTTGEPAFAPYVVLDRGGLRVGVLGLTTPGVPNWEEPEHYRGLRFEAMDTAARKWVRVLREEEGCDLVVVLAHTGIGSGALPVDRENYGARLTRVAGIDLLLTGHSHRNIAPHEVDGVVVSQPRSHAMVMTRIDLELERLWSGWRIAGWQGENLETGSVVPDPTLMAVFESDHEAVVAALSEPIGNLTAPVSVTGCRIHDCEVMDLIHTVQLEASGAELSLASLLTDRTPDLPAGPVNRRWVHALYTYPNTLVAVLLTGAQIRDVLEHAARYYDGLECPPGGGCIVLADSEIPHYSVDSMAGLSYRIDPTRPEGDRVRDLRHQGAPLDLHRAFKLVCNNYRANGGGRYPHLADAEVVWTSSREVSDLISEYLVRVNPWRPTVDGNWWVGRDIVEGVVHAVDANPRREGGGGP